MAWFGAAYATNEGYDKRPEFAQSETQGANALNQAVGGQQNAQLAGQQVQQASQANAMGLANSARGGRGNSMMRSAMMQAPQARQAGLQAQYQQQQANYQNAATAQDFEQQRRAMIEQQALGTYQAGNNDALRQQRETNNTIEAINGMMSTVGAAGAASDERMKRVLGGKRTEPTSPGVLIMIGSGGRDDDNEEPDDDAGEEALDAMRALDPATFEYKDEFKGAPGAGPGEYTGIMAQDLERTPAGKGTVSMGPDGMRRVDGAKLSTLNSAALSKLVKDVDKLRGAKRG